MAEEQIVTNIVAKSDFSNLIADLNKVSSALTNLQAKLNATNKNLSSQVNVMNRSFAETMRSTGQFSTHFVSLTSDVDKFGSQLDKGQIKLKQFFQTYQSHIKTNGGLIRQLAQQQVQLQNAILQPLGKNAEGLMQYNVHIPAGLDKIKNKSALAKQELQIMNKVIQEGANQMINWGKNTQWAGRQLTVGLTLPLAAFGKASADAFRQADQELTRLTKVYGGLAATSSQELGKIRQDVSKTAAELAKSYGSSFKDTIALAADIAATGKQGNELLGSIKETTRLAVLGEVDRQDALKATLAIQTAFKQNTEQLSESINFLNAVENQTSTTLNDLVEAIPRAGPIIQGLGGSVEDLALYLTAMREGGINASEGANALKSGLASLINPTKVAKDMFAGFGISLTDIVQKNAGDTTATILELQSALETLNPLQKQQALEQLFGKFQFARMNALFENLGKQGSQTLQVMDLMKASSQDLANIAGRELSMVTESASGKYKRALEGLKADLAGVGEQFLNINTHLINIVDGILKFVGKLPGPVKTILGLFGGLTALAGPMIMLTGVLANFFGYIVKGISHFRALSKGGEGWKLLTPDILAANKAGGLVEQTFYNDAKASEILNQAIMRLSASYQRLASDAAGAMIATNPQIATTQGTPIILDKTPRIGNPLHSKIGAPDTRAAAHARPVGLMTQAERDLQTIHSVTPNPIEINQNIGKNPQIFTYQNMPNIPGLTNVGGVSTGIVAGEAAKWHTLMATLSMQTKQEVATLAREIKTTGTVSAEFLSTYSTILPQMTQVIDNAVIKSAQIIQQTELGQLRIDQAQAKIIAINAQLEADMAATSSMMAQQMGRTANLTTIPLTGEAVVEKSGKSNLRALFRDDRTSKKMLDAIARATGVKTWGGGYSIETTLPKKFATGGRVFGGPRSDTTDTQFEYLPEGSFVLNRRASDALLGFNQGGMVPAMVTPGEILIENPTPQELDMLEAYNNQFALGGKVNKSKNNYGRLPFRTIDKLQIVNNMQSRNSGSAPISNEPGMSMDEFYKQQRAAKKARTAGAVSTNVRNAVFSQLEHKLSPYEKNLYVDPITGKHQDRAHGITGSVAEGAKPVPGYFGIASVSPYNKIQNKLHKVIKTRDVNPVTDATAQDEILPDIFAKMGSGKWFENNAKVNGILDIGKVQSYINHLRDASPFGGKWDSRTFGMSPLRGLSRQAINRNELADYLEYLMSGEVTKINKTGIILNDASALVQHKKMNVDKAIDLAEKIYNGTMSEGYNDHAYYAKRSNIDSKVFSYNAGGIVGGRVRSGKYNYGVPGPAFKSQLFNRLGAGISRSSSHGGYDVNSLTLGMGKKLFGGSGLSPKAQNLMYNYMVENLQGSSPDGYVKTAQGKMFRGFVPQQANSILFGAAMDVARLPGISKKDREILALWSSDPYKNNYSKGLLSKITGKMFGYNSGGVVGGRVRSGKYNYGIKTTDTPKMLFDPNDPYKNAFTLGAQQQQPRDYQGSMMAGFGMQAAGSMIGGGAGTALMFGGLAMQFAPMLSKMTSAANGVKSMEQLFVKLGSTGTKVVSMLGNAFKFLKGPIGGPLAIAAALTAVFLKLKQRATEFGEANRLAFGGTEKSFSSVGITKYKTLEDRLKAVNEQMELNKAKAQSLYNAYTKAGPTGITLSIDELNKAIENAKKNQKDYVEGFNRINDNEVVKYAADLKAQFVAMGLSATEASNQIYGILKASSKAHLALQSVSSTDFRNIIDQTSALTRLFDNLGKASTLKNFNAEEFATGLDTLINSVINYQQALIGTKDALNPKNIIDEAESLQKTMEKIGSVTSANAQLTTDQLNKLKEQNIVYASILSTGETLESITAKILMYNSQMGAYLDFSKMSAADSVTMAQNFAKVQQGVNSITESLDPGSNPLLGLAKPIKAAEDATKNYAEQITAAKKLDENYYKDKIAAINKVIKEIQKEADARIKALQAQQDAENVNLEIQKKQLEYQDAVASGNMAAAASAQLDIKQLIKQKQYNDTINSIKEDANKKEEEQQAKIEKLNAEQDAKNRAVNIAVEKNQATTANLAELKSLRDNLESATIAFRAAQKQGSSSGKNAALSSAIVTLDQMKNGSAEAKKAYSDLLAQYQVKASDGPASLAGKLVAALNNKIAETPGGTEFKNAVDIFDAAVKKFAGETKTGSGTKDNPITVTGQYELTKPKGNSLGDTKVEAEKLIKDKGLKADQYIIYNGQLYKVLGGNKLQPITPGTPRAMGGRVAAGREYRVGERGEETFRPDISGTIYPNPNTVPKVDLGNFKLPFMKSFNEQKQDAKNQSWGDWLKHTALQSLNFAGPGLGAGLKTATAAGREALLLQKTLGHLSSDANLGKNLIDPLAREGAKLGKYGRHPLYFAEQGSMYSQMSGQYGSSLYNMSLSPAAKLKTLFSKGYLTPDKLKSEFNINPKDMLFDSWTPELISKFRDMGYLGYKAGDGIVTNWVAGAMKGFGLKNSLIPKFKDGINSVPVDMLAQLHANEAVIPANMNPFNPNANNATMGNTYNFAPTINAAPGMDERQLTDMVIKRFEASVGLKTAERGRNKNV